MAWKLLLALAALTATSAISSGGNAPMDQGDCMQRLVRGYTQSNDDVRSLLTRLEPDSKLGRDLSVRDYLRLSSFSPSSCFRHQYNEAKKLCHKTKAKNLRQYCEHFNEELIKYCRVNLSEVVQEFFRSQEQLVKNIRDYISEFDEVTRKQYDERAAMQVKSHCEEAVYRIERVFEHLSLNFIVIYDQVAAATKLPYARYARDCKHYTESW